MIHQYKLNGYNIVLDVYSGSVHLVDDVAYDCIALFESTPRDQIIARMMEKHGHLDGVDETELAACLDDMNVAQVLVEQLAKVGITATIKPVEWETWVSDTYTNRNFESTVIGFDAATLSAGALLNRWMSDNDKNMINYNNPEYDKVMQEANASTDDAKQTELYKQAAAMLSETAANVYIQDLADFVLLKNNLDGYQFYPLYVMDLSTVHYVQ